LASDRSALPPSEGYLFLYFYGIERRLLVDEVDRAWALQEVVRLRKLDQHRVGTRDGRSFRQYSTGLLWYEIARTPRLFDQKAIDKAVSLTEHWTHELLNAPLSWLATHERPLPPMMARQIAANDPTSQRSVVIKRLPSEFEELFDTRYREMFGGEGMVLRVSKRDAWHTYRPASGGLTEMRCQVPNPLAISSQFQKLPEIWNSCIADLRKLSRVVSTSTHDGELTAEAWEAMPPELRAEVDHPLTERVAGLLAESPARADSDNQDAATLHMLHAGRFAELLGIERRPILTATQSQKLAATVEFTGYGVVPDARISPIRYGWDDLIAAVPGLDNGDVEPSRYNAAACVLRLGLAIAQADGEADEVELRMLADHVDAIFDLSSEERQRLAVLRKLLLRTGSDIQGVARKISEMMPPDARQKIGRLLVAIAATTNGIDRSERAALRKAFRALDLTPEVLEATIAEVAPEADESEVSVKAERRDADAGEPIRVTAAPSFRLNYEAISIIMSETREVSVMLAAAMGAAEVEQDASRIDERATAVSTDMTHIQAASSNGGTAVATAPGPGGRYGPLFVALTQQERWDRAAADRIARTHGLMLDAGVEAINDWAYDALGTPLIEDEGDELVLELSLLSDSC